MFYVHSTEPIPSIISLASDANGIELSYMRRHSGNNSIAMNKSSSNEKTHSISSHLKKIITTFDCLKVETRGIERVSTEDRNDLTIINTAMIWIGANTNVSCFVIGILGPAVYKLSLYHSFIAIIIFNVIGIIPTAAMACFGPASGLRTMVFTRYSWGYYGASFISILNIITALGWSAANSITGAQTLRVVFNDKLPLVVGIIIVGMASMIVSFVGYKWIHIYERYSWIPVFIGYCIVAGVGAKYFTESQMVSANETIPVENNVRDEICRIFSFGTTCFGAAVSWCSYAGDYNTYFPEDISQMKIFLLTYFGNFLPMILLQLLGAAVYTGTYTNQNWAHAYEANNVGGLLGASLSPIGGFSKFFLVLFSLSTIAANIPNIYSLSLSAQVVSPIFKHVPRVLYTIIGTAVFIVLGIVAANKFNDALTSFMEMLSYWFAIYIVIVFEDHLFFRRCSYKNYDFNSWNDRKRLPISLSAFLSGLIGVVGSVLGMSQTWFSGPIAKLTTNNPNQKGADIGFELGFLLTAITFPIFRIIELRFIKR